MMEARGRAGRDCMVRRRCRDPKAKSERGTLSLSLPLRIWDASYPCPPAPSVLPLIGQELIFISYLGNH